MANLTLIMGECGSGKTTSLRNLNPDETFIINIENKPLPFRNFKNLFRSAPEGDKKINYYAEDNAIKIVSAINKISKERPDIKYLVIDDFGYLMSNEFFAKASEKGYEKYSILGQHAWMVLNALKGSRNDLYCFVMAHNELTNDGKYKIRTIGRMLDEKFNVEGIFPHVYHALVIEGRYRFLTHNDGKHIARSPLDMFKDDYIENDLQKIIEVYEDFYGKPEVQNALRETLEPEPTKLTEPTSTQTFQLLHFLLEQAGKDRDYVKKVLRKYNANDVKDLSEEVIAQWIASLQKEVNMRND
jgi:hypothetical protein